MSILDRYIFKTVFFAIVLVAIVLLGLDLIFAFVDKVNVRATLAMLGWHT